MVGHDEDRAVRLAVGPTALGIESVASRCCAPARLYGAAAASPIHPCCGSVRSYAAAMARPRDTGEADSTPSPARLLTVADLAARWQVPEAHVYRLTRRGVLPVVRLGRYYRYRVDAIEQWELAGGADDNER